MTVFGDLITVTPEEAEARLGELLVEVERGRRVRIERGGKLVAVLGPAPDPLEQDPRLSQVEIMCDLTAPLGDDVWPPEQRGVRDC